MNILVKGVELRVECQNLMNSALWTHILEQIEREKPVKEITIEEEGK